MSPVPPDAIVLLGLTSTDGLGRQSIKVIKPWRHRSPQQGQARIHCTDLFEGAQRNHQIHQPRSSWHTAALFLANRIEETGGGQPHQVSGNAYQNPLHTWRYPFLNNTNRLNNSLKQQLAILRLRTKCRTRSCAAARTLRQGGFSSFEFHVHRPWALALSTKSRRFRARRLAKERSLC